nr:hypothetical protein [Methanobrevibacter arboriphilus]
MDFSSAVSVKEVLISLSIDGAISLLYESSTLSSISSLVYSLYSGFIFQNYP